MLSYHRERLPLPTLLKLSRVDYIVYLYLLLLTHPLSYFYLIFQQSI